MIPYSTPDLTQKPSAQTPFRKHPILTGLLAAGLATSAATVQAATPTITNNLVENVTKGNSDTEYTFNIRVQVKDTDAIPDPRPNPQEEFDYTLTINLDDAFSDADISYQVGNVQVIMPGNETVTDANGDATVTAEQRQGTAGAGGTTGDITLGSGTLADGQFTWFSYDLTVTYADQAAGPVGPIGASLTVDGAADATAQAIPSLFIPHEVVSEELTCPGDVAMGTTNLVKNGNFATLHGFQAGDDDVPAGSLIADSFKSDSPFTGEPPRGVFRDGGIVIHPSGEGIMLRGNGSIYLQYPFPGDETNNIAKASNMLASAGLVPGDGAAWIQEDIAVEAGKTYNFIAYVSNPMWIGQTTFLPNVQLVADGTPVPGAQAQLAPLAMETVGDDWHLIHGQITPTGTTTTLEIRNTNKDATQWNQFVVTQIGLYECGGSTNNTVPVAKDDTATTSAGTAVEIDVIANDTAGDGANTLSIADGQAPDSAQGTATVTNNKITFTPATDFTGAATFSYTLEDEGGDKSVGNVTVTVTETQEPIVTNPNPGDTTSNNGGGGGGAAGLGLLGLAALGLRRRRFKR